MSTNDLKKFLAQAQERRVSVGHIQGPHGNGKSTTWIPYIWTVIQSNPSTTMIYIQATEAQRALLTQFLSASGDDNIIGNLREGGRLKLWSSVQAVRRFLGRAAVLGGNVVVCMDLDVVPTAYGEFLLACLIERAMQVHGAEDDQSRLILFTVGAGQHRYPTNVAPLASPEVFQLADNRRMPEFGTVSDPVGLGKIMMKASTVMVESGKGIILGFLTDRTHKAILEQVAGNFFGIINEDILVHELTAADVNNHVAVEKLLADVSKGYAVIHVDPSISVTLPFRNVQAVIYSPITKTPRLTGATGLVLAIERLCSGPELDVYRSYTASASDGRERQGVILALNAQGAQPDAPTNPPSLAYGSELILLVLLAFLKWKVRVERMPLARLGATDRTKWFEATRRLTAMGMVVETGDTDDPIAVSDLGSNVVPWLAHTTDWHVAFFLAHIQSPATTLQMRVMVRLAAIIEHEVPLTLLGPMSRSLMRDIVNSARGPAASAVDYGHLWVTLSVWEVVRRRTNNFNEPRGGYQILKGRMLLTRARAVYERVMALESTLKLQEASDESMDKALAPEELTAIMQALADAWLCNLFWIPKGWNPAASLNARTFAHADVIDINTTNEAMVMDGLVNDRGLFATALDIASSDHGLKAWNTMLLDTKCLRHIHEGRMGGGPDVRVTFASAYAHRGRADE